MIDLSAIALASTALLGGGGIAAFVNARKAGRETEARAESIAAETLIAINRELREELARRDVEIERLRHRADLLQKRVDTLQEALGSLQREFTELQVELAAVATKPR